MCVCFNSGQNRTIANYYPHADTEKEIAHAFLQSEMSIVFWNKIVLNEKSTIPTPDRKTDINHFENGEQDIM